MHAFRKTELRKFVQGKTWFRNKEKPWVSSTDQPAGVYTSGKTNKTKRNRSRATIGFSKRSRSQVVQIDNNWRKLSAFIFRIRTDWIQEEKPSGTKLLCLFLKTILQVISFQDNRVEGSGKILHPNSKFQGRGDEKGRMHANTCKRQTGQLNKTTS